MTGGQIFGGLMALVAMVLLGMFVGERYGWLTPVGRSNVMVGNITCGIPVSGTDAKGEWYALNGVKYRMDIGSRSAGDLLCGDGKSAHWKPK